MCLVPGAQAHPYASGLTNRSGTIYFLLNESASDVSIVYGNGAATNDLGALSQGINSFGLSYQSVGYTNYSIVVTKAGAGSPSQISVDATNNSIYGPRGVAVNRNPRTGHFGRVYVCNANAGVGVPAPSQFTGRGMYILNADTSDALGRGTNSSLGGITLGSSTTYAPYRPFVGPDDSVYVGDSGGGGSGGGGASVWKADPDIISATPVFEYGLSTTNFGACQSTPFVTGSLASGNLVVYCLMWNYPQGATYNDLYEYSIGAGPLPWTAAPTIPGANAGNPSSNGVLEDLCQAPDGKFFVAQNRTSSTGGNVSLRVFDSTGATQLWDSSSASGGVDPFVDAYGVAVSPDGQYVATIANTTANFFVLAKLTNGLPDLSTVTTNATGIGMPGRGIAFDAADNVYVVSGGNDRLRVFSLGLTTTAITSNDVSVANGAFRLISSSSAPVTPVQSNLWTQLANSPGPSGIRHDDVYFTDPTNGWASQNNYIYRTTNGGVSWTTNLFLSGTHFRSVVFATPKVGFGGNLGKGSYDGGTTDTNVLYRSYDGGVTWSNVPGLAEAGMKGLCAMFVLDASHIYGAGRVRGPAYFIKSVDGGTNWSIVNLTAMGVMNGIMDVYFADANNGWVVGMDTNAFAGACATPYYGRIAKTTDGGNTWTPVVTTPISCFYFWKMSWPATNIGYVALQQNGTYDTIVYYKTSDGGSTWVSNGIPEVTVGLATNGYHFYLQGLGFVSPTEGWIGGASGLPSYGSSFLHTTDGGATWSPAGFNDSYFINRIRFLSPTLGFAAGANVYLYSVPLAITAQPQSQVLVVGANVSLSVSASGQPPIHYRW